MSNRILFFDLAERDRQERARASVRKQKLDDAQKRLGSLGPELLNELNKLNALLGSHLTTDVLFLAVSKEIGGESAADVLTVPMQYGLAKSQLWNKAPADDVPLEETEEEILAVCGLLQLDGVQGPKDLDFISKVTIARGEYNQYRALFGTAFGLFTSQALREVSSLVYNKENNPQGYVNDTAVEGIGKRKPRVLLDAEDVYVASTRNIAAVVRRMKDDGVSANDPWVISRMESAFAMVTGMMDGGVPSAIEIMLPELEEAVDVEIIKENLHAIQAIYFAFQLEEMRLFQVVDKIVELFKQGLLPLGKGTVGDKLFKLFKTSNERLNEAERRDLYFRAFGAPGGNPAAGEPNRDFNELWLRFVSAVSSFSRQISVERIVRNAIPMAVSQEQVRKAARDLGANLSRSGYGIAFFAATDLQASITTYKDILQNQELRTAFGARDMWQVIDRVNVDHLGGAKNTHRYRTQAKAGAVIIRWLAESGSRLSSISGPVLSIDEICNPQLIMTGADHNPVVKPTDWDLVNACEQWLAVAGVQDQSVEQYSQPIESPTMTSQLMAMPQVARDVLAGVGVNL